MKRTLGSLLALAAIALVVVPAVHAEVALETRTSASTEVLGTDATALAPELPIALPPIEVDIAPLLKVRSAGDGSVDAAVAPEDEISDPPGTLESTVDRLVPDEPSSAVAVAGALTGLALLGAAAAHYWGSLKFLLGGAFFGLFSRIDHNHMLDNDVRNRVFAAVDHNPGVTIKEITMLVGCGWGTAVYHLKRLEAERLIVSERNRQFRRFFKNGSGISNEAKGAFSELKNPTSQKIAQTLLAEPGSCQKDLCDRLGISAPLASKYLSRLKDAGLVSTERDWKLVKYYPTSRLESLLPAAHRLESLGAPTLAASPVAVPA